MAGCRSAGTMPSIHEYNNKLIGFQTQAVERVANYFSTLDQQYDGENLIEHFIQLRDTLHKLETQVALQEDRKRDSSLKAGVLAYIQGLQQALQEHEQPIVELLSAYSGSASELYRQDRQIFSQAMMHFAQKIAQLDQQLEQVQTDFSHKYNYQIGSLSAS
ncbi:MAG: hypothetical protein Q4B28_07960 [bacterium]|nr:hypothetical protein [bacterium]